MKSRSGTVTTGIRATDPGVPRQAPLPHQGHAEADDDGGANRGAHGGREGRAGRIRGEVRRASGLLRQLEARRHRPTRPSGDAAEPHRPLRTLLRGIHFLTAGGGSEHGRTRGVAHLRRSQRQHLRARRPPPATYHRGKHSRGHTRSCSSGHRCESVDPPRCCSSRFTRGERSLPLASQVALPKLDFPPFDGENPQFWKTKCEKYFDVYGVQTDLWVRVATLHFTGNAARWLQVHEKQGTVWSWESLCEMVVEKFGREHYQNLLRQFNTLKQHGTVVEYMHQFEDLMHQILAHNPAIDSLFFTTQFLEGLKAEIKSGVILHRPKDLDTAFSLATMQEELLEALPRRDYRRAEGGGHGRFQARPLLAIGAPPARPLLMPPPAQADDRRGVDGARAAERRAPEQGRVPEHGRGEDRVGALRAYRRARGLCFKCGERWGQGHQCAATVQLHVVEELLDLLQAEQMDNEAQYEDSDEDILMSISKLAVSGATTSRTVRLVAMIEDQEVLVLVDSGSSHSFLSDMVADKLKIVPQAIPAVKVRIANGGILQCDKQLANCVWCAQGQSFTTDLRILALGCYDMVLGMDWLEEMGEMKINWAQKHLQFQYKGKEISLQGIQSLPNPLTCTAVSVGQLQAMERTNSVLHMVAIFSVDSDSSTTEVPATVQRLLHEFAEVFQEPDALPPAREWDHDIPLVPGARPISTRQYRYTPAQKTEIEAQVTAMLRAGLIQPSASPFSSPVLLVRKKDLTWRFCIDFRSLNSITVKNKYPLPVIDELLDELAGACWFSKLDLRAGFHQIRLRAGEEYKTAFRTHQGHFEFRVMPFGLTNAPATFQGAMNTVLAPLLRRCVLVFLDDILVYSATLDEHVQHLRQVLCLLKQHDLKAKLSKCTFSQPELSYLGHRISASGVATEQDKIQTVQEWPIPVNLKELRGFLGLAGYYRKFVRHFGLISRPLTELLKKGSQFIWTPPVDTAFRELKRALTEAPVLALPDFAKRFVIETDASGTGVGAVLMQDGHPIAYLSKALCPKNLGLSAYEKECLALLMAVDHWRPYLQHSEFTIRTDQKSLLHLSDQRLNTPIQQRAFTKLLGLQFQIQYKQGLSNRAADALSRRQHSLAHMGDHELSAIAVCRPAWLETIQSSYHQDPEAQERLIRLSAGDTGEADFQLKDGLIRFRGRIWIGSDRETQAQLVRSLHDSAVGGHSGFHATYHRVKRLFAWTGMKQTVQQFVRECVTCQRAKTERCPPAGLLQPLDTPAQPWEVITLDFIEGLPRSANHDTILVIVDKFSKFSHFIALKHPFTALDVAKAYMAQVFSIHGLPQAIVSDRDRIFTSTLWQELFRLSQTELRLSSSYHPQSDGQTERVNQCLEAYLRCAVHSCPGNWFHWLHLAQFWYNTSVQSALGMTPFQVMFGRSPREFGTLQVDQCTVSDLETWLHEREVVKELLKQQLIRAQQRMKHQADKHRTEREFAVGEQVFLKLQPYIQTSVARRPHQKLAFRYYGPYTILQRVGSVAYKLALQENWPIETLLWSRRDTYIALTWL